jgi:hypothetical protein
MRNLLLAFALVLSSLSAAGLARADVPGPHEVCNAEGLGCTACTTTPGGADPAEQKCIDDALAQGLVLACTDGVSVEDVYYCPKGVTVPKSTTGGCSIGSGAAAGNLLAAGAALAAVGLLARRARRARAAR